MIDITYEMAEEEMIEMPARSLVTPHILKNTAIAWATHGRSTVEDAVGFFSTSIETIRRTYWHHSPKSQESAVSAIDNPVKDLKQGLIQVQSHKS